MSISAPGDHREAQFAASIHALRCIVLFVAGVSCILSACKRTETQQEQPIETLPYLGGAEVRKGEENQVGARILDPEKAHDQMIMIESWLDRAALIIDRDGREKLRLSWPEDAAFCFLAIPDGEHFWMQCDKQLAKLDYKGAVIDSIPCPDGITEFHHEILKAEDGSLLTLGWGPRPVTSPSGAEVSVWDTSLLRFAPDGSLLKSFSYHDRFQERITKDSWEKLEKDTLDPDFPGVFNTSADFYHGNTIDIVHEDGGAFPRGTLIITVKHLSLVAALEPDDGKVRWTFSESLEWPHSGAAIQGGKLVRVLDNGSLRGRTEIVVVDPEGNNKRVMVYAPDPDDMYTHWGGHIADLANGHWLVTETSHGRLFEMDPQTQEVFWEYRMPLLTEEQKSLLRSLAPNPRFHVVGGAGEVVQADYYVRSFVYRGQPLPSGYTLPAATTTVDADGAGGGIRP